MNKRKAVIIMKESNVKILMKGNDVIFRTTKHEWNPDIIEFSIQNNINVLNKENVKVTDKEIIYKNVSSDFKDELTFLYKLAVEWNEWLESYTLEISTDDIKQIEIKYKGKIRNKSFIFKDCGLWKREHDDVYRLYIIDRDYTIRRTNLKSSSELIGLDSGIKIIFGEEIEFDSIEELLESI